MPYYTKSKPVKLADLFQVDGQLVEQILSPSAGECRVTHKGLLACSLDEQIDVIELLAWKAQPGVH